MEGRKILIPVDGSEHSERAFDWYAELLHSPGDEVLVVHCIELPPVPLEHQFPYGYNYLAEWQREADKISTDGKVLLNHFAFKCKQHHDLNNHPMPIRYRLLQPDEKSPSHSICDVAKREEVSMIVLGARGVGKIRRTVLGSVSDYVVHHAHVPVAVVPSEKSHFHFHHS
ncbi:universal stress protein PHOS32 [Nematostella vectensis]|uniref:universal stress protein PHOS32 n=1 Tax=Nematostella vectensis TaxID=45351 RepID=UPI00138FCA83|nr:universal stress protein PHOS32 [Nematostella vectensis]